MQNVCGNGKKKPNQVWNIPVFSDECTWSLAMFKTTVCMFVKLLVYFANKTQLNQIDEVAITTSLPTCAAYFTPLLAPRKSDFFVVVGYSIVVRCVIYCPCVVLFNVLRYHSYVLCAIDIILCSDWVINRKRNSDTYTIIMSRKKYEIKVVSKKHLINSRLRNVNLKTKKIQIIIKIKKN